MSVATAVAHPGTDQFKAKAYELRDDLKELGSLAPEVARETFQAAKNSAQGVLEHTREKAVHAKEGVEEFIRERPFQSVMIAAGAGVLVGLLLSRSK